MNTIKFTTSFDIEIPYDSMVKKLNEYLNDLIEDSISDYNDIIGCLETKEYERFLDENRNQIRMTVLNKLCNTCFIKEVRE